VTVWRPSPSIDRRLITQNPRAIGIVRIGFRTPGRAAGDATVAGARRWDRAVIAPPGDVHVLAC
jgi:hypothetical protein